MTDGLELMEHHFRTLCVMNAAGDILTSNDPYPPHRKRTCRFRVSWDDTDIAHRFRDDIGPETRDRARSWIGKRSPESILHPSSLTDLAEVFGVPVDSIGWGPAYTADRPVPHDTSAVLLTRENESCLSEGFLEKDEIDYIDPSYIVIQEGQAVSTCMTVRRTDGAIEAGVDTFETYRGKGYAVQATAAWLNATLDAGLVPFYSTSSDNTSSQRVAEKVGLQQFATELKVG
jgi:hypothetical protein